MRHWPCCCGFECHSLGWPVGHTNDSPKHTGHRKTRRPEREPVPKNKIAKKEKPTARNRECIGKSFDAKVGEKTKTCPLFVCQLGLNPLKAQEAHAQVSSIDGIGGFTTTYFHDPAGIRNELFSEPYPTPGAPGLVEPIEWTVDDFARGVFYYECELDQAFLTEVT